MKFSPQIETVYDIIMKTDTDENHLMQNID